MNKVEGRELELKADYLSGLSMPQVAAKHGVHPNTVFHLFKRHGISVRNDHDCHRKYAFNEHAFDVLTPEAAYWLGFIYADGYFEEKRNRLVITIHDKDEVILHEFKAFLNSDHRLFYMDRGDHKIVSIELLGDHFGRRLRELGVMQRKSLTIAYPNFLSDDLNAPFIRGYLDGDGSATFNPRSTSPYKITFTSGAEGFLLAIQRVLMDACQLGKTKLYAYPHKRAYDLRYGGRRQVTRIADYLTRDGGFYLNRKLGELQRQT